MKTPLFIICFFIALNLCLGFLFQASIRFRCYTELLIIATTSFIFWWLALKGIDKISEKWRLFQNTRHFLLQTGIGLSAALANILVTSSIMFLLVFNCEDCTDPNLDLLNGTLTNNLAVHLLCYFTLVFIRQENQEQVRKTERISPAPQSTTIALSSGNKTYQCPLSDILYLETSNNCIVIHTTRGNFVRYQSLKSFLTEYSNTTIKRVHRSYAVNLEQVHCYEKNKNGDGYLTLRDQSSVKFSRSFFNGLN